VESFSIGANEVTYDLYWEVKTWALDHGYAFRETHGREGNHGYGGHPNYGEPTADHRYDPVTTVSWWDAIVWCNAYSEWAAAQTDSAYDAYNSFTALYTSAAGAPTANTVLRSTVSADLVALVGGSAVTPNAANVVLPLVDAAGFRLPNGDEWEFAARGSEPSTSASAPWNYPYAGSANKDEVAWYLNNANMIIQAAGLKQPNTLNLYDMSGNAEELASNPADQTRRVFVLGGNVRKEACVLSAAPASSGGGYDYTGFRVAAPASVGEAP
jgi:formylglycine-generating enzyme required for sulfatase activity